jgi:hypothetical protein
MIYINKGKGVYYLLSDQSMKELHAFVRDKMKMSARHRAFRFKYPCYVIGEKRHLLANKMGAHKTDRVSFYFAIERLKVNLKSKKLKEGK